jgi:hypothetical protein
MQNNRDFNPEEFANKVRNELSDLPKAEISALTDGLEADLIERLSEEGAFFAPGEPSAYAAELREAAGVPSKSRSNSRLSSAALIESLQALLLRSSIGAKVLEFGISIRPVWWVLRAVVAWALFAGVFYSYADGFVLLPLLIFLSIQLGRKKWFTHKFFTAILLPLNLIAVIAIIPVQEMAIRTLSNYENAQSVLAGLPGSDGLRLDGEPITELHVYDSEGSEISEPTFKDQRGNQIELPSTAVAYMLVPDVYGMSPVEASLALKQAGIESVDFIYLDDVSEKYGVVVSIDPATPGSMVTKFDVITLTIGLE